jgi:hypothetical protein
MDSANFVLDPVIDKDGCLPEKVGKPNSDSDSDDKLKHGFSL